MKEEPLFNPIWAAKESISLLELGVQKAVRDYQVCFGSKSSDLMIGLNGFFYSNRSIDNASSRVYVSIANQEKKNKNQNRGFASFLGDFLIDLGNVDGRNKEGVVEERNVWCGDPSCVDCVRVNVFAEAIPNPFRTNSKDRVVEEGRGCKHGSKSKVMGRELNVSKIGRERSNVAVECLIGFMFAQLANSNMRKFDPRIKSSDEKGCDYERDRDDLALSYGSSHLTACMSNWDHRKLNVNRFWGSLKFAKVGNVLSNTVGISRFVDEGGDDSGDRLHENPSSVLPKASMVVSVAPSAEMPTGSFLRSALAGGLSCAFSCFLMHPIDTVKTRVQASTLSFLEILSKLPEIGVVGVYKGSIPAIWGQFTSHGLRAGLCEAGKFVLINVAPTLPEIQVNSISSFCSTVLGTTMRIPCEVLKQRLQADMFDNVGDAIVGTWQQDGLKGFFRGTGATLLRELPFYVAGSGLYEESKKAVERILSRELEPWEALFVGAVSGGLAAVTTTPFDVIKTKMMTTQGQHMTMSAVALSILHSEGPLGLFKGAVPRFFWVAPLGAINLAGYELARKALEGQKGGARKRDTVSEVV